MRIKSLHIENFRGLVDERIEFDNAMTVLAGVNGGGKSSVLEAISIMLSWLPVGLTNGSTVPMPIRRSAVTRGRLYSKLSMVLSGCCSGDISLVLTKRVGRSSPRDESDMSGAEKYASDMRVLLDSPDGANVEIPVFAYYGVNRNISGYPSPLPSQTTERTSVYAKAFDAGTDFKKFSRWMCEAISEREAAMADAARLPAKIANRRRSEIDARYSAVAAVKKALADFGGSFCVFSVKDGELFAVSKNVPAADLSAGEKTVAALIADIAMRMSVANPQKKNPLDTSAIVLIDELDLHLHPGWQAAVAERLPRIFTGTQFVISAHSPSIMALSKNLYRFRDSADSLRLEKIGNSFGRAPSDLLSSVLNASREPATAAKISRVYELIDERNFGAAQNLIDELNDAIPDDPEIVKAEYLVRALGGDSAK